jgi:predicted TIM-barrel fold metal-dependent hydrolase
MIDCDVHVQIGDVEEILAYVEPAQRDWFRAQAQPLGLPGYPWVHPHSFFRHDVCHEPGRYPGSTIEEVRRDVLDAMDVDVAILNADDAITLSLMASPYRAAELARAHNEWLREGWLDAGPRTRGSIVCPAQDPRAAAAEIQRMADDPRFAHVLLGGGAERPYGEPRYLPIFEAAADCGLPVAIDSGGEGLGLAAPPGGAGVPTFYIEWHTLGSAGSIMAHLVSLLVHGVFERFPTLKVMLLEGGLAWLPGFSGDWTRTGARSATTRGGSTASRARWRGSTSASPPSRSSTPTARTSCSSRCSRLPERPKRCASPRTIRTGTSTTPPSCSGAFPRPGAGRSCMRTPLPCTGSGSVWFRHDHVA